MTPHQWLPEQACRRWSLVPRASRQDFAGGDPQRLPVVVALLSLTCFTGLGQAADLQACRRLRTERDEIASRAMEQEISLVRSVRARICPELERTAEAANARDQLYAPLDSFDYAAWNHCRRAAEEQLGRSQAPLFRNHQGFVFYTIQGARFAEQADHLHASFKALGCE